MMNRNNNGSVPQTGAEGGTAHLSKRLMTKADEMIFYTQKLLYYKSLMIEQRKKILIF
jgi:hypothetical protein